MITSLDRIEEMIEWRFEENRITGRIKTRDLDTMREAKIRLAGFKFHDRDRARENAQISIALDIIRDIFHGQLYTTKQLSSTNPLDDDDKAQSSGTGRGRGRRKNPQPAARDHVGADGPAD